MDREEFLKKKTELVDKINELEKEYIKANSPIPQGTKVKVITDDNVQYGFIESYYLFFDRVLPTIFKMKKDGTQSKKHMYFKYNSKIEVCNE